MLCAPKVNSELAQRTCQSNLTVERGSFFLRLLNLTLKVNLNYWMAACVFCCF